MGFKKSWEVGDITSQVHSLAREISSPYNDGYTQWHCKQDLYQIKQLVDQALARSPNFGDLEQEWLQTQEKKHIIKILKS
jgi:predicted patatin/cPLA2 family phospholipase